MTKLMCTHPGCARTRAPHRDHCSMHRIVHRELTRAERERYRNEYQRRPRHASTLTHQLVAAYTELAAVIDHVGRKAPYKPLAGAEPRLFAAHKALQQALLNLKRTP